MATSRWQNGQPTVHAMFFALSKYAHGVDPVDLSRINHRTSWNSPTFYCPGQGIWIDAKCLTCNASKESTSDGARAHPKVID
jgi:hypothetical protein